MGKLNLKEITKRRYTENSDLPISTRRLIDAWVVGSSAPSYDDEEILLAIIAYGDARVKEVKTKK